MHVKEIQVKITADTTEFDLAIKKTIEKVKELEIEIKMLNKARLSNEQRRDVLDALVYAIKEEAKSGATSGLAEVAGVLMSFDSYSRSIPADKARSGDENALSLADRVFLKASEAIREESEKQLTT